MITQIEITNFKRFENRLFRLAPLTVLTGFNGTGKSSFIQSLLMLNQACTGSMEKSTVELNSSGLELGEASNVIRYGSDSDEIRFNMQTDSHAEYEWKFGIPTDRSMYLDIRKAPDSPPPELSCMGRDFTYLSAERLGPRDILGTSSMDTDDLGVGPRGEYVAQLLSVFDRVQVSPQLRYPTGPDSINPSTVLNQTEQWISEIACPVVIEAQWPVDTRSTFLKFRVPGIRSESLRPVNIGFGVSYCLPVIVAGLLARHGGMFIVENPEAHLHPKGQSMIGGFLARLASTGVQVIVETHSDHVINGIRSSIGVEQTLPHDDAIVYFFSQDMVDGDDGIHAIEIQRGGALSSWPKGFFDQIEIDLAEITRIR